MLGKKKRNAGEGMEKRTPPTLLMAISTGAATLENIWRFLKKLKIELPYNPTIHSPEHISGKKKKSKTLIQKDYSPQYSQHHYLQQLRHGKTKT